ncbi:hypothetical protein Drorol1_Dr00000268 [Drosera rotundifolia]
MLTVDLVNSTVHSSPNSGLHFPASHHLHRPTVVAFPSPNLTCHHFPFIIPGHIYHQLSRPHLPSHDAPVSPVAEHGEGREAEKRLIVPGRGAASSNKTLCQGEELRRGEKPCQGDATPRRGSVELRTMPSCSSKYYWAKAYFHPVNRVTAMVAEEGMRGGGSLLEEDG